MSLSVTQGTRAGDAGGGTIGIGDRHQRLAAVAVRPVRAAAAWVLDVFRLKRPAPERTPEGLLASVAGARA